MMLKTRSISQVMKIQSFKQLKVLLFLNLLYQILFKILPKIFRKFILNV